MFGFSKILSITELVRHTERFIILIYTLPGFHSLPLPTPPPPFSLWSLIFRSQVLFSRLAGLLTLMCRPRSGRNPSVLLLDVLLWRPTNDKGTLFIFPPFLPLPFLPIPCTPSWIVLSWNNGLPSSASFTLPSELITSFRTFCLQSSTFCFKAWKYRRIFMKMCTQAFTHAMCQRPQEEQVAQSTTTYWTNHNNSKHKEIPGQ